MENFVYPSSMICNHTHFTHIYIYICFCFRRVFFFPRNIMWHLTVNTQSDPSLCLNSESQNCTTSYASLQLASDMTWLNGLLVKLWSNKLHTAVSTDQEMRVCNNTYFYSCTCNSWMIKGFVWGCVRVNTLTDKMLYICLMVWGFFHISFKECLWLVRNL